MIPVPRPVAAAVLAAVLAPGPGWTQDRDEELARLATREATHVPGGEWADLAACYQRAIERGRDALASEDGVTYVPLAVHVQRRLARLPGAGVEAYRRRFDGGALALLEQARRTGRLEPLVEIVRRYLHTTAGDQALLLAGAMLMDLGRFGEALDRLRQIHPSLGPALVHCCDTRLDLAAVRKRVAYCLAELGEIEELERLQSQGTLPRELQALARVRRESAERAADGAWPPAGGPAALSRRWIYPRHPILSRQVWERRLNVPGGGPDLPPTGCLPDGDRLHVVRFHGLVTLDLASGKSVWSAPLPSGMPGAVSTHAGWGYRLSASMLRDWRLLADPTGNGLSLAAGRIYSVQGTFPPGFERLLPRERAPGLRAAGNQLLAHDPGRRVQPGRPQDQGGGPLDGVYWLAAPLAHLGRLFLPGEREGDHGIYCLEPDRLTLVWKTPLGAATRPATDGSGSRDTEPRTGSGSPLVAGHGLLFWVSHAGVIAALEPATGQTRWITRYQRSNPGRTVGRRISRSWAMGPPFLAGSRLLCAPMDAEVLLCLDASTGQVLWRSPRAGTWMLVGPHGKRVYTIGDQLNAFDLVTGRHERSLAPDWKLRGRPLLRRGTLWCPTSSGIVAYDLPEMVAREPHRLEALFTPLDGDAWSSPLAPLGNLFLAGEYLISAHPEAIVAFQARRP